MTNQDPPLNDDFVVEREQLDCLEAAQPPPDFSDRVVAAKAQQQMLATDDRPDSPWRSATVTRLAALVAVAAAAVFYASRTPGGHDPANGSAAPVERQSVILGHRGVAVAEGGSSLQWKVDDAGAASVDQTAGDVFYRVEPGAAFSVHTPLGDVTAVGTCFRVEIEPMKSTREAVVGAAVGAVVAAAVVVTVYEGRVLVTNTTEAGSTQELVAGDRRAIRAPGAEAEQFVGAEPIAPPSNISREELLSLEKKQRDEIVSLRERVRNMGRDLADARKRSRGPGDADDGRPWFDPSTESLQRFAEECRLRFDLPPVMGPHAGELPDEFDLSAEEKAAAEKAFAKLGESFHLQIRELYIEATGDPKGADELSLEAMAQEIQDKSDKRESDTLRRRLAQERAGLLQPPASLANASPYERYMRLLAEMGDAGEHTLAEVIGTERAHDLRVSLGGWGWRMEMAGCSDDHVSDDDVR